VIWDLHRQLTKESPAESAEFLVEILINCVAAVVDVVSDTEEVLAGEVVDIDHKLVLEAAICGWSRHIGDRFYAARAAMSYLVKQIEGSEPRDELQDFVNLEAGIDYENGESADVQRALAVYDDTSAIDEVGSSARALQHVQRTLAPNQRRAVETQVRQALHELQEDGHDLAKVLTELRLPSPTTPNLAILDSRTQHNQSEALGEARRHLRETTSHLD
jgi:hypothetical protein